MRIVGTDVRPSLGTGDANLRPWALDKMPDERVVPLTERGRKKVSGNFKNAKYWRLEMVSGICFVQVSSVSNSGQWIRKRLEI